MEEEIKVGECRPKSFPAELDDKAKGYTEFARQLDALKAVMRRYKETLQRRADS